MDIKLIAKLLLVKTQAKSTHYSPRGIVKVYSRPSPILNEVILTQWSALNEVAKELDNICLCP
jgi:hypothetical protein